MSYVARCISRQQFTANDGVLRVQDVTNFLGTVF